MASRTISLSEDAYRLLREAKGPDESFSDVVRRLVRKPNPLDFIGIWKDIPDAEIEQMKKDIKAWKGRGDAKFRRKTAKWSR